MIDIHNIIFDNIFEFIIELIDEHRFISRDILMKVLKFHNVTNHENCLFKNFNYSY